jgi:hypothetical protein
VPALKGLSYNTSLGSNFGSWRGGAPDVEPPTRDSWTGNRNKEYEVQREIERHTQHALYPLTPRLYIKQAAHQKKIFGNLFQKILSAFQDISVNEVLRALTCFIA